MNSVAEYLMDNAFKTVVIITRRRFQSYSDEILQKYVGLGGSVHSTRLYTYILSQDNRLIFCTPRDAVVRCRGMTIDVLLVDSQVDGVHPDLIPQMSSRSSYFGIFIPERQASVTEYTDFEVPF